MSKNTTRGWLTVSGYAKEHKVSTQNIYKRLKHNSFVRENNWREEVCPGRGKTA